MRNLFLILTLILASSSVWAVSAFKGQLRENFRLYKGPGENFEKGEIDLKAKDEVVLLGSSVGGYWAEVMNSEGKTGWLPLNIIDLYRISSLEYDDLYYRVMQERRRTSRWNLAAGFSYGGLPLGLGGELLGTINLSRRGLLDANQDQIELGSGFRYHLGVKMEPNVSNGELVNPETRALWEIPIFVQWLFRLGYRGNFMIGPRVGLSVVKDPYARFDYALPFIAGAEIRYFPGEDVGLYVSGLVLGRSVFYFSSSVGLVLRY